MRRRLRLRGDLLFTSSSSSSRRKRSSISEFRIIPRLLGRSSRRRRRRRSLFSSRRAARGHHRSCRFCIARIARNGMKTHGREKNEKNEKKREKNGCFRRPIYFAVTTTIAIRAKRPPITLNRRDVVVVVQIIKDVKLVLVFFFEEISLSGAAVPLFDVDVSSALDETFDDSD